MKLVIGRTEKTENWFEIMQTSKDSSFLSFSIVSILSQLVIIQIPITGDIRVFQTVYDFPKRCDRNFQIRFDLRTFASDQLWESQDYIVQEVKPRLEVTPIFHDSQVGLLRMNWTVGGLDKDFILTPYQLFWKCNDSRTGIIHTNSTEAFVACSNELVVQILSSDGASVIPPVLWQMTGVGDGGEGEGQQSGGSTGIPATVSLALVLAALIVSLIMLTVLLKLYSASEKSKNKSAAIRINDGDTTLQSGVSIINSSLTVPLSFEKFVVTHRLTDVNVDCNISSICDEMNY